MERNADGSEPRPQVGMGVLVLRGRKVLLGKRRGAHGAGSYAAPGGHIEFGESLAEAARREVLEETGLRVQNIRLLAVGSYMWGEDRHYIDVDMVCEAPEGEPQVMEPHKCEGWAWYDLDDLPEPLFIVTRRMIEAYLSGNPLPDPDRLETQPL
ncbi:MAG: NUDIX hydrolase [Anaerolineae bacterium]